MFNTNFLTIDIKQVIEKTLVFIKQYQLNQYATLYIVGQGGSILLFKAIAYYLHIKHKNIVFLDKDILPHSMDVKNGLFIFISRSGRTREVIFLFEKLIKQYKIRQAIILTNISEYSMLHQYNLQYQFPALALDYDVTGRYSLLTESTILPCMLLGIDPSIFIQTQQKFLNKKIVYRTKELINYYNQSKRINIFLTTHNQLYNYMQWLTQLYGESLGKNGYFMTPMVSVFPQDLHTLFQLYIDGPQDKVFQVYTMSEENSVRNFENISALDLIKEKHPIYITKINSLQELLSAMMYQIMEVVDIANHLGIDAFNQPAIALRKRTLLQWLKQHN